MKKILYGIVFFVLFLLMVMVRSYWDSYRFYESGLAKESVNKLESVRYYESSIKSDPIITTYADKAKQKMRLER